MSGKLIYKSQPQERIVPPKCDEPQIEHPYANTLYQIRAEARKKIYLKGRKQLLFNNYRRRLFSEYAINKGRTEESLYMPLGRTSYRKRRRSESESPARQETGTKYSGRRRKHRRNDSKSPIRGRTNANNSRRRRSHSKSPTRRRTHSNHSGRRRSRSKTPVRRRNHSSGNRRHSDNGPLTGYSNRMPGQQVVMMPIYMPAPYNVPMDEGMFHPYGMIPDNFMTPPFMPHMRGF